MSDGPPMALKRVLEARQSPGARAKLLLERGGRRPYGPGEAGGVENWRDTLVCSAWPDDR